MMQLAQVSQAVNGQLLGADMQLKGVTTDSRGECDDRLFIALNGENFDAHDFVAQAQLNGAAAVMVERRVEAQIPTVLVLNTHQALKDLAAWWRAQFVIPVIAVTGSVGKTSVKEMLGTIFAQIGQGLVTKGNLNNEIGLPLTLLRLDQADNYAVVEMGMNHAGEIARLTDIAKPTIALVNNAAAAHLEGLGSIEAVAQAKGEIFQGLSDDGVGIINADDQYADLWRDLIGQRRMMSFGLSNTADITASYELRSDGIMMHVTTPDESFEVSLTTVGKHNVSNALAAIAVATAAHIPVDLIQAGLARYRSIDGRLNTSEIAGVTLIDDTYNANPASMQAAIEVLTQFKNTTLIVGDMAELGDAAQAEHLLIGELAAQHKIDRLLACGQFADLVIERFAGDAQAFTDQASLLSVLNDFEFEQGAILIKGSRSAKMERVVEALFATLETRAANNQGLEQC